MSPEMKADSAPSDRPAKWPKTVRVGSVGVKIYRQLHPSNRSGWTYVVAWNTPAGRLRQKFADEQAALNEARLKAGQISAGRVDATTMSVPDREELQAARKIAGTIPLLSAIREWSRARELAGDNIIPAAEAWAARNQNGRERVRVADALDDFLKASRKLGRSVADDHANTFARIRARFGGQFIDTVTAKQIDAWLDEAATPGTHNTWRKRIVAVWSYAQKKNWLPQGVPHEAQNSNRADEGDMKVGIISAAEFARLLEHFRAKHPEYVPALALAGFAGLRASEVHEQRWEDINLEAGHLRVTKAKRRTPSRRLVPLSPAAVEWLMLEKDKTEFVCGNLAIDRIREIGKKAKFNLPENCFRHSFITHRVAQTQHIAQTALEAGNSAEIIRKHYLELVTQGEGEKWFSITPRIAGPAKVIKLRKASA